MPKPKDWTAEDLARQAEAAKSLVEYLQSAFEDDEDLIQDSIEGETDFLETIDRALEQIAEADMMAGALKQREAELAARRKRFEGRSAFMRGAIEMAMAQAAADLDLSEKPFTLQTVAATVTLKLGQAKVVIEDESLVPAEFWRTPDPVLDKAKLNEYCKNFDNDDDDDVLEDGPKKLWPEGVEMSPRPLSLTIRRK